MNAASERHWSNRCGDGARHLRCEIHLGIATRRYDPRIGVKRREPPTPLNRAAGGHCFASVGSVSRGGAGTTCVELNASTRVSSSVPPRLVRYLSRRAPALPRLLRRRRRRRCSLASSSFLLACCGCSLFCSLFAVRAHEHAHSRAAQASGSVLRGLPDRAEEDASARARLCACG